MIHAVGGIIIRDENVLLIKRANHLSFGGLWSNPGGKIEKNETPEQAIVRELSEELGIKTKIVRFLCDYHDFQEEKLIGIYNGYLLRILENEPKNQEPDKITDLGWFNPKQLPEPIAPYVLKYLNCLK